MKSTLNTAISVMKLESDQAEIASPESNARTRLTYFPIGSMMPNQSSLLSFARSVVSACWGTGGKTKM